jgi:gamma-glutamyl-gamma-aminobutyrate hydrolase PuuD
MTRKVYIVGGNWQYEEMFTSRGWELTDGLMDTDLVQFTGGQDVSPHLYDEEAHPRTGSSLMRDEKEQYMFESVLGWNIPMAGICRGGQFLNVMNGGKMWQHVDGHTASNGHAAFLTDECEESGKEIHVSSTHHQMMIPGQHGKVMMYAYQSTRRENMLGGEVNHVVTSAGVRDIEAVLYEDNKTLCFQPHPEFQGFTACRDTYFDLLELILEGE